jgi:hypothetical protein
VNQRYPDDLPHHLILIDIGARIIVDYMPDVLPR